MPGGSTEIAIVLKLVGDQFVAQLKQSESGLGSLGEAVAKLRLGAKAGLAAVAASIEEITRRAGELAQQIENLSTLTGLNVTAIQEWTVAMSRAGESPDAMVRSMKTLAGKIHEAMTETGDAAAVFQSLGVAFRDAAGNARDPEAVLRDLARAAAETGNSFEKTDKFTQLLGRGFERLLPTLSQGAKGIDEAKAAAYRLGAVLSEEQIRTLSEMDKAFSDLGTAISALAHQVGALLAPAFTLAVEALTDMIAAITEFVTNPGIALERQAVRLNVLMRELGVNIRYMMGGFAVQSFASFKAEIEAIEADGRRMMGMLDAFKGKPSAGPEDTRPKLTATPKDETGEIKKQADANLKLAQAQEKLADAQLQAVGQLRDARRRMIEEGEKEVVAYFERTGQITATSEEEQLRLHHDRRQQALDEDRALLEQRLRIQQEGQAKELAAFDAGLQQELGLLIVAGKQQTAARRAALGATERQTLTTTQQTANVPLKEKIQETQFNKTVETSIRNLSLSEIERDKAAADVEANLSHLRNEAAADQVRLEQQRAAGEITEIQFLQITQSREQQLRQETLTQETAKLETLKVGDVAYYTQLKKLEEDEADHLRKTENEKTAVQHAAQVIALREAQTVADAQVRIGDIELQGSAEQARRRLVAIQATADQELRFFQGTAVERAAKEQEFAAQIKAAQEEAGDGFVAGWLRGLRQYVRETDSAFGLARDTARQTAQAMQQGFEQFFFNVFEGKITRWRDVWQSAVTFIHRLMAQFLAQAATTGILKVITQFGASSLPSLFGGGLQGPPAPPGSVATPTGTIVPGAASGAASLEPAASTLTTAGSGLTTAAGELTTAGGTIGEAGFSLNESAITLDQSGFTLDEAGFALSEAAAALTEAAAALAPSGSGGGGGPLGLLSSLFGSGEGAGAAQTGAETLPALLEEAPVAFASLGGSVKVGGIVRYLAQGGPIEALPHMMAGLIPQYFAKGGASGTDTVPAMLTPGEYVLSVPMVKQIQSVMKSVSQTFKPIVQHMAEGGPVLHAMPMGRQTQIVTKNLTQTFQPILQHFREGGPVQVIPQFFTQLSQGFPLPPRAFDQGGLVAAAPGSPPVRMELGSALFAGAGWRRYQEGGGVGSMPSISNLTQISSSSSENSSQNFGDVNVMMHFHGVQNPSDLMRQLKASGGPSHGQLAAEISRFIERGFRNR